MGLAKKLIFILKFLRFWFPKGMCPIHIKENFHGYYTRNRTF